VALSDEEVLRRADELRDIMNRPGWQIVVEFIEDRRRRALKDLRNKDPANAVEIAKAQETANTLDGLEKDLRRVFILADDILKRRERE